MDLSVVIVNWNAENYLKRCLESVYACNKGLSIEVFVVDNNSSDGSVRMIRSDFPQVKLLENKDNPGFGAANNRALKACTGEFVLILNPDTEVRDGAVGKMTGFLRADPDAGAAGAKLLNADGSVQMTCARNYPDLATEFFWLTTLVRRFPKNRAAGRYLMSYWDHNDRREVDCLSGACIMARSKVLKDIGFFDEDYFMYGEDVDLCYRIKKAGWHIWYLPEAEIVHYGGGSTNRIAEKAAIYDRIAISLFFRKHYGALTAALYRAMCLFIGSAMAVIAGASMPFMKDRAKPKKVFFENLAILAWSLGLRNG
ncbi:MAG: glycosyltransferase family 2 protein [Candidatus Omnitrophota bacterium]